MCSVDGCDKKARNNGVCKTHGAKQYYCKFADCSRQGHTNKLCYRHRLETDLSTLIDGLN